MKGTLFIASILLSSFSVIGQNWSLDYSHAKLGFSVTHLLLSDVEGNFKKINCSITSSKEDFSDAVIEFTGDASSIYTDDSGRDEHLRGEEFFNSAKFPTLNFKSTSFKKVSGKNYKMAGNLTMHGVTKPIVLDVVFNGTGIHPYNKKTVAGFKLTGSLNRNDFAIGTAYPNAVLSDIIEIKSNLEFTKN